MIPRFRAWITFDNINKMFYNFELAIRTDKNKLLIPYQGQTSVEIPENEYILMQSTDIKDKNGKEIFLGDIVKYHDFVGDFIGEIYMEAGLRVLARIGTKTGLTIGMINNSKLYEVIGNIYENPELLEKKEHN